MYVNMTFRMYTMLVSVTDFFVGNKTECQSSFMDVLIHETFWITTDIMFSYFLILTLAVPTSLMPLGSRDGLKRNILRKLCNSWQKNSLVM